MHDVAREAGVSRGTVSRVVNGEPYVSPQSRIAVEAAIARTGYTPSSAARNLVRQRSQAVGFIVHEPHALFVEDPNIGDILLGANRALSQADYQMSTLVVDSKRDTERIARYLRGGVVDGVILVSARENDEILDVVRNLELVAAFVGHPRDNLPYVGIDNLHAAEQITKRLRETGRRRIGMIAAALDRDSGIDRLEGFKRALGASFDAELVVPVDNYSYANGVTGMRKLLAQHPDIDGVFAASDAVAAGALEVLHDAGVRVPEQLGIVGFDDSAWALRCQPALSTVRQPAVTLGERAAQLVLAQLRNEVIDTNIVLDTPIIWRDSA